MKKIRIFSALIALLGLGSCGEDFFNLTPNYEVAVDDIYETASDFDIAVLGCYAKFQTQVNYYTELCEYRSDNLYLDAVLMEWKDGGVHDYVFRPGTNEGDS